MALSKILSVALHGLDAVPVDIEVDVSPLTEKVVIVTVGLPDAAVKESKDRVLAAIKNSGFHVQNIHCTINLAPGDLRKEGALYDLPIALGLLRSLNLIKSDFHADYLIVGELGLGGELRPIHGALAISMLAKNKGKKGVILPSPNAKEAAAVPDIDIIAVAHLKEAVQFLADPGSIRPVLAEAAQDLFRQGSHSIDFADVKGQAHVKRAAEIAVAGGHNLVLSGPPGSGKSMIAKALVSIMPDMTIEEALETTKIHSIAGLLSDGKNLVTERPFRSPHHTVSYAGLIGGGVIPRPGEISLAHNGILFLDELPEFPRAVLEVLRQPLEDRKVTISRANGNFTYPTNIICVAAMNPCPCGLLGHPEKFCRDTPLQIERYRNRISGPLWDRLDMHVEVPALKYNDIMSTNQGESSAQIKGRVAQARERQHARYKKVKTNGQINAREIKQYCSLDAPSQNVIKEAIDVMGISARACDRLLKVALTIADLEGKSSIEQEHLMEALSFRDQKVSSPQYR